MSALMSRRDFVRSVIVAAGSGVSTGRAFGPDGSARLNARVHAPRRTVAPGVTTLTLPGDQTALLLVPARYVPSRDWPLVVGLHGATQRHGMQVRLMGEYAESRGFLLLVMDSSDYTWDGIRGSFDRDVRLIDHALSAAFDRARIDPARVILEGFSDGASYALALGRANGDLFTRVVAFSPGFVPESDSPDRGRPSILITHGRQDPILPIDRTSRRIVGELRRLGYDVTYREFDGGHTPGPPAAEAVDWMIAGR